MDGDGDGEREREREEYGELIVVRGWREGGEERGRTCISRYNRSTKS